jgi:hypothetical protein
MLPCRVLPLLYLLIRSLLAFLRSRRDVALENLVLRHQLQVALRTNRSPRIRLSPCSASTVRFWWAWRPSSPNMGAAGLRLPSLLVLQWAAHLEQLIP